MRRRLSTFALLAALVACLAAVAGCGAEEEEGHAVEGEPLELGELLFNVQITRFLNESSIDDRAYLEGAEPLDEGEQYLGVFLRIINEGEGVERVPLTFEIESSSGEVFDLMPLENEFAMPLGAEIPGEGQIPEFDSPAASGPIKGSMLLFAIPEEATEDRPFELHFEGPDGEPGVIELDL
jgi:hypothetical protein